MFNCKFCHREDMIAAGYACSDCTRKLADAAQSRGWSVEAGVAFMPCLSGKTGCPCTCSSPHCKDCYCRGTGKVPAKGGS